MIYFTKKRHRRHGGHCPKNKKSPKCRTPIKPKIRGRGSTQPNATQKERGEWIKQAERIINKQAPTNDPRRGGSGAGQQVPGAGMGDCELAGESAGSSGAQLYARSRGQEEEGEARLHFLGGALVVLLMLAASRGGGRGGRGRVAAACRTLPPPSARAFLRLPHLQLPP